MECLDKIFLGSFEVNAAVGGEAIQMFVMMESVTTVMYAIYLEINSNHGSDEYTWFYRLQVHGTCK